ncbi:MAG: molecular chaperone SurA [Candidatus Parabeggiatoa sp. nov. 2]|nr:MAG: hypothetical protein B6247_24050 [Beggiatoa sp. 4572_84]RKZ55920.1 MAG: molecular chaperone SurA [Gammaproteobacteria bacterium]HEC86051.1 molecular chaperone SurA [Thioploca sp.]
MKKLSSSFALCCLLIGNLSVPAAAETEVLDYIVAVVNDDVIVNTALQQELRPFLEEWRKRTGREPPRRNLEKQVLENLIMTTLQLQLAERIGIKVEDSELNDKIRQIAAQKQMDLQTFRNRLEKEGYSYELAREALRKSLIIKRLQRRKVVNRITVTTSEIETFLANQKQQGTVSNEYHLWYILIAMSEAPSPEDIEAKQRKAEEVLAKLKQGANFQAMAVEVSDHHPTAVEGGDLGWLKAGEIRPLLSEIVSNMAVGEVRGPLRDSRGFHIIKLVDKRGGKSIVTQTKVRHILIQTNELVSDSEAQIRLERLRERIVQGDDFVELARAHSDDVTTAANGGLLDWLSPGNLVPEFEDVMDSLPENKISKPFKSRYGWHILQVLERRKHDNTKQALRTQAELQISQRKIKEESEVWLRKLREEAYIEDRLKKL